MAGAPPHNVEFEAAKFLQKLIHESTDEPSKLATKLYVILQHMKASGKENSMPYQVISRAMETVINQHGLDIDALMSSRIPSSTGTPGESAGAQAAGSSQNLAVTDTKQGMSENDVARTDGLGSSGPPGASTNLGAGPFQGSASQRSGRSFEHESPSSMETRSTNSHSQDRRETTSWEQQGSQKDLSRASMKRKRSDSSAVEPPDDSMQQLDPHSAVPDMRKERLSNKVELQGNYPGGFDGWKQGFKGPANFREPSVPGHLFSPNQGDVPMTTFSSASGLGATGMQMNADRILQSGNSGNLSEMGTLRGSALRDTGKAPAVHAPLTNLPFKEHHLKQLRAQCLVFLSFRNGLSPKRLHLEIALGNILSKEGTSGILDGAQGDLTSDKGKQPVTLESSSIAEVASPQGTLINVKNEITPIGGTATAEYNSEADAISKESENPNIAKGRRNPLAEPSPIEAATQSQERTNSSAFLSHALQPDISGVSSPSVRIHEDNLQPDGATHAGYVVGINKQLKPDLMRWSGGVPNEFSRGALPASIQSELGTTKDISCSISQSESDVLKLEHADNHLSTSLKAIQGMDSEHLSTRPESDANLLRSVPHENFSEAEEEDNIVASGLPPPKYTLSEKWIMAHQKRKVVNEQKWVQNLQMADQRIAVCFSELKETVRSSEDISAKTRSVIELKKLQLLELQRRLRRNIMNDFFKPIQTEMDRLKSIKKHRIGRRMKHVEKYEQKMKEERQKRIRERQKEFFGEIESHKERLEDVFKFKRERCKGFNRYVKEFHKRKERIHREKLDRIQREKINLLKINDVEGYLRMVQDAKSDRVDKLLKETEKYLLTLGSRLKEAKASARQIEMDDNRTATFDESSDIAAENEDENDQAKHYKESNEKYYLIAHSIKENIAEQPIGLLGGKLREYQMNGLRWLVSLYNNHLNGILADEMGLGKTVQVISLICYLMEAKNDRGPFLVVVPSSVLPGWAQELSFWAPGISKIVYSGPPEERRKLFKESILPQKFNVLLTTYEYLMNKHDRPKLSKIHWHYVIIDEGHRIKNASCKLNADLKHYRSYHRLLLTGTPLQNNLEELWALLNFLLPNIFNSSEDFSQWFNKPFESNGDNSPDEALLSEEENLLIINRLHQVLRPFVLRRLKHKVENELPEKIERLVRCEASAYQKLLMKRVEDNLGSLGVSKGRAVHNSVMELRNICNHPYLSQLHAEEVDNLIPKHFLPPIVRLCGKLEMLDRLLPKLKATNHRVLFFSTMTRLLDIMEEYLVWKQYRYLRLDGHTSGQERGALIDNFNQPDSPFFIFLLSIRAGGVGVNLQAADTVIIFDTDWNPQVDLQAQARAHRIGQKKDVLVLRLETVQSVEEQVRASAEHKLGVANQSITAGFFDNNTSAEDRREYLESLLRESKKEEAAPVLDDDSLNDILARSESEIDVFEAIDQKRREEEMATWKRLTVDQGDEGSESVPPLPSRLVTEDDLKVFYEAMKVLEASGDDHASNSGLKRRSGYLGGFDTQQYGRGKRAREVRSYEEQWTEEEFEKICQAEALETSKLKGELIDGSQPSEISQPPGELEQPPEILQTPLPSLQSSPLVKDEVSPPVKRGRGRPRRTATDVPSSAATALGQPETDLHTGTASTMTEKVTLDSHASSAVAIDVNVGSGRVGDVISSRSLKVSSLLPSLDLEAQSIRGSGPSQPKRQGRKAQPGVKNVQGQPGSETVRRRGRKAARPLPSVPAGSPMQNLRSNEQPSLKTSLNISASPMGTSEAFVAGGQAGGFPQSAGGPAALAVEGTEASELAGRKPSSVAGVTTADKEGSKFSVLPPSTIVSVAKSMPDLAAPTPQYTNSSDHLVKQALSDSSAVGRALPEPSKLNKVDAVSQETSISKSLSGCAAVPTGGSFRPPASGPDLKTISFQPVVSSSESQNPSSTGLRPSRRQSQKPQSGSDPVRRRGRKRSQSILDNPALPVVQDQNLPEPLKSADSLATVAVTYVAPPPGAADMGTGSRVVTVPMSPLVPGSSFVSSPADVSGSGQHIGMGFVASDPAASKVHTALSDTPDIPSETPKTQVRVGAQAPEQRGQRGEVAPRRRGRKRSAMSSAGLDNSMSEQQGVPVEVVDRKVIATRSRQMSISQSINPYGLAHSDNSYSPSTSKDTKATVTRNSSSNVFPNASNEKSALIKNSRPGGAAEEIKLFHRPADFPPISCKGKTNVIVLALEFAACEVELDYGTSEKQECSNLQNHSAVRAPMLKPEACGLNVSSADGAEDPKLDEELSAPPGFETPLPSVLDAEVREFRKSDDGGMAKSPNAKVGSVVLALESTSLTDDPTIQCQNTSEKENCAEDCTIKSSGHGISVPSKSGDCKPLSDFAADELATAQTEEDMSAPPGFDIPHRCVPEIAVAETSEYDDNCQRSRPLNDSTCVSRLDNYSRGPSDVNTAADSAGSPTVFPSVGSGTAAAFTLESKDVEDTHESGDVNGAGSEMLTPPNAVTSDATEASTLQSTEEKESHESGHGTGAGGETLTPPNAVAPDVMEASTLQSTVEKESHESGHGNGAGCETLTPPNAVAPDAMEASTLQSTVEKESHESGDVNVAGGETLSPPNAITPDANEASTLQSTVEQESHESGDGNGASGEKLTLPNATETSTLQSTETESHGSGDGNGAGAETLTPPNVVTPDTTQASELQSIDEEESHAGGDGIGTVAYTSTLPVTAPEALASQLTTEKKSHVAGDGNGTAPDTLTPTNTDTFETSQASTFLSKEEKESHVTGDSNGTSADTFTPPNAVPCDAAQASELQSKEEQEPFVSSDAIDAVAAALTPSIVVSSDDTHASTLQSKEEQESHVVGAGNGATADTLTPPDAVTALALQSKAEQKYQRPDSDIVDDNLGAPASTAVDDGKAQLDCAAASITYLVDLDSATASNTKSEEQEQSSSLGPDNCNIEFSGAVPPSSDMVTSDATETRSLELKKEDCEGSDGNIARNDAVHASNDISCDSVPASDSKLNEEGESHGPDDSKAEHDIQTTSYDGLSALTALESKAKEDCHGVHDVITECSGDAPMTSLAVVSETRATSTLEAREKEEFSGLNHGNAELAFSDASMASPVDCDSTAAVTLDSNKQEESQSHGPGHCNLVRDAADLTSFDKVNYVAAAASCSKRREEEESQVLSSGPGDGKAESEAGVVHTTSHFVGSGALTSSILKPEEKEDDHEADDGSAEHDCDDVVTGSVCDAALASESKEQDELKCHVSDAAATVSSESKEDEAVQVSDAAATVSSESNEEEAVQVSEPAATVSSECKEEEAVQVSDAAATVNSECKEEEAVQVSDAAATVSSESKVEDVLQGSDAAASILNSKEKEDCCGSHDCGDASMTLLVGPDSAAASALESKEQDECQSHGPDYCNTESDAADPTSSDMAVTGAAATKNLKPEEKVSQGPDASSPRNDASLPLVALMNDDCDQTPVSTLQPNEEAELHGADGVKSEDDGGDFPTTSNVVCSDSATDSTLELNEKKDGDGMNDANGEHEPADAPAALHAEGPDTVVTSAGESATKEDC